MYRYIYHLLLYSIAYKIFLLRYINISTNSTISGLLYLLSNTITISLICIHITNYTFSLYLSLVCMCMCVCVYVCGCVCGYVHI